MNLTFEWDHNKAAINLKNHGVSFDEASTVFDDVLACIFDDEDHSQDEHRETIIGHSILNRLLIVCFTERSEDRIRIFSVRFATKYERKTYEEGAQGGRFFPKFG
jgi:uncharacterized DUF497 family protein